MSHNDRVFESHPSYGMAGFSRVHSSGRGPRLFQSHTDNSTFITFTLKHAEIAHDLGRDWVHGQDTVLEIAFSAAQFAELLTTMNMGDGVPCTITSIEGHKVAPPPAVETEAAKVRHAFRRDVREHMEGLDNIMAAVQRTLAKPTLTKADRTEISGAISDFVQLFKSTAPFMLDSFEESAEKISTSAKAEIDAFLTNVIHRAGLDHLRGEAPKPNTLDSQEK